MDLVILFDSPIATSRNNESPRVIAKHLIQSDPWISTALNFDPGTLILTNNVVFYNPAPAIAYVNALRGRLHRYRFPALLDWRSF
jgi:hypothetical protein